ncbi:MAG: DASS family sodium-coupled anion symporter [Pirellulaceae bacterium]
MTVPPNTPSPPPWSWSLIKVGLGPALGAVALAVLPALTGMPTQAAAVAGLALWMAMWWMTEALPLAATALLPIVVTPLIDFADLPPRPGETVAVVIDESDGKSLRYRAEVLPRPENAAADLVAVDASDLPNDSPFENSEGGILVPRARIQPWGETPSPIVRALTPYADRFIFLFLGGFMVARGIERWQLHRRAAIYVMSSVGSSPALLIAGAMLVTAAMSMWLSNTATTLVMLPVAVSLTEPLSGSTSPRTGNGFRAAMLLSIAYASTMGGLMTPIGTPPNALLIKQLADHGYEIGFGRWMLFAKPLSITMLVITWFVLTRVVFQVARQRDPRAEAELAQLRQSLGPLSRGEWLAGSVFAAVACGWVLRGPIADAFATSWPSLGAWLERWHDATVAIAGAIVMFALPVSVRPWRAVLNWDEAKTIPWDVLLLFGGGLCLSRSIEASSLDLYLGQLLTGLSNVPPWIMIAAIALLITFLTELTSNMATAALFLPIAATLGYTLADSGASPGLLMVPAALAASCAFMLPVATPPNALVFAGGGVRIKDMTRAGLILNLAGAALIAIWVTWVGRPFLGL